MGRDSNPRWSCPHSGFQDRRIRPLCHPSETFLFITRRSFKPAVLFAFCTFRCCSPLVRARLLYVHLADSYARPSHSTALPPILNFFTLPILYYFFLIAILNINAPATNITADNNCPIVKPQLVKKPICTSGARNCSQNILNKA